MKKGVSMPIQVIVLLAISAVVVIVLLLAFVTSVGSKTGNMDVTQFVQSACFQLKNIDHCGLKDCDKGTTPYEFVRSNYMSRSILVGDQKVTLADACAKMGYGSDERGVLQCCGCDPLVSCE